MIWVKVCGLTTPDAVAAAVDAGVNAVGFVFAESKRKVTAQQAAELARDVPRHIARVAVMLHPSQAELDEVWSQFRPDVLQTDIGDLATLRVPAQLQVTPVVRAGRELPGALPNRLLFEGPVSGAGATADWSIAARLATQTQLILAGGLKPSNVAEAIATARPFGVDVSSGVEARPGMKDPTKIYEFVRKARAADDGATQ
ncbi:phosphoribosylanthranilate isomerase [Steroidobacter sp. S1-65]|uniref:N-(5'-phosphoribosyl)anthranilate isomerase n=1 Tax=Steroidobacter gossypii TaxID=2805490 RepID=A0ABS1WTJ5_9GAMM|nr:phosphoribosylanthranilate isomerase [Steroidobacter gossypii]MBM0104304.1 phosphoribosylanthranilate isomerase [Steroidobacter gossypii]